jgi:ureidoglycolate hydrolase
MTDLTVYKTVARPLSIEAFAPYGICGKRPDQAPTWLAGGSRIDGVREGYSVGSQIAQLWNLGDLEFDSRIYLGSVRYYSQGFRVAELERHRGETQTWFAVHGAGIIAVAEPTDSADGLNPENVRAFIVEPGDTVALNRATWMCHFFPLGEYADYMVVTARRDPEQDRDLTNFAKRSVASAVDIVLA